MSNATNTDIAVSRTRIESLSRSHPVEQGCIIKVPLTKLWNMKNNTSSVYGIVGCHLDYYQITTVKTSDVELYTNGLSITCQLLPLPHLPIYDSDMVIVRFPKQNASLNDPNIDH